MENIKRILLVVGVVCSISMLVINESGVPITLVNITHDLGLSLASEHWLVNAYVLSLACCLLPAGRIVHYFGCRKSNLFAYLIFIAASYLIAHATMLSIILLSRILQGISAAVLINSNIWLINQYLTKQKMISIVVIFTASTLVITPILSGALTQYFSWRWLFWLNIPLALIALLCTWLYNAQDRNKPKLARFRNLLLINTSLLCLTLAMMQIPQWGIFDPRILILLALALFSLMLSIYAERNTPATFIDLSILQHKQIVLANVILIAAGFTMIAEVYWILWLRRCMQFSPLMTGLALLPALIPTLLIIPFSRKMTNLFGHALPVIIGNIMAFLGMSLMMRVALLHTYEALFPAILMYGFAPPLTFGPTIAMATQTTHTEQQPLLSALAAYTSWQFGAALGIATMGWVLLSYIDTHPHHISAIIAYSHGFVWSLLLPIMMSLFGLIASLMYWQQCPKQVSWLRQS